jgi:hypothetical protein
MKDLIARVANCLDFGSEVSLIHTLLLEEGLTEEEAYLTYIAAKLLHESRMREELARRLIAEIIQEEKEENS